jgi:DNA-binding transcriptional MerR regulator
MEGAVHIGKAAKLAGVSVDTIRFYKKVGLIKSVGRSAGGYRLFEREQIRDLTFVRHAQELGFSLNEVKELLALRQKDHACSEVQSMLKRLASVIAASSCCLANPTALQNFDCARRRTRRS